MAREEERNPDHSFLLFFAGFAGFCRVHLDALRAREGTFPLTIFIFPIFPKVHIWPGGATKRSLRSRAKPADFSSRTSTRYSNISVWRSCLLRRTRFFLSPRTASSRCFFSNLVTVLAEKA